MGLIDSMDTCVEFAKKRISLKLWTIDFAKRYCSAMLNNVFDKYLSADDYNKYADEIDNLNDL